MSLGSRLCEFRKMYRNLQGEPIANPSHNQSPDSNPRVASLFPAITIGTLFRVPQYLQRLHQRHDLQASGPLQRRCSPARASAARRRWQHLGRALIVSPFPEAASQIAWYPLHHDGGDRHERPVFHTGGKYGIFLSKVKGIAEGAILSLCVASNYDVHLEERVKDVDLVRGEVLLAERVDLGDLAAVSIKCTTAAGSR